jgi:hypothetical protein
VNGRKRIEINLIESIQLAMLTEEPCAGASTEPFPPGMRERDSRVVLEWLYEPGPHSRIARREIAIDGENTAAELGDAQQKASALTPTVTLILRGMSCTI